jgi:hypothetical protein
MLICFMVLHLGSFVYEKIAYNMIHAGFLSRKLYIGLQ